jgi:predicted DsbA family dithiol-disulfide isomerase
MNDVREGAVCGVDGCSTQDIPSSTGAERAARQTLSLEVISDAICPWCWVAKHRLDRAIAALGPETAVQVTWRPFELNPDMPKDGLDRRAYRSHKFGSWERSQALDGQVAEAARSDGLVFRHELIGRTPNTRDAHRLIWLAGREGVQGAVVEALFSAYFHDGRDVGDRTVLIEVGASAGLDPAMISTMLASKQGETEVAAELQRAHGLNVSGVPTVLVDGRPIFSGAIRFELMQAHLRTVVSHGHG